MVICNAENPTVPGRLAIEKFSGLVIATREDEAQKPTNSANRPAGEQNIPKFGPHGEVEGEILTRKNGVRPRFSMLLSCDK